MLLRQHSFTFFKTIVGILIFIAVAIASTYFYFVPPKTNIAVINPGLLYTCATIIVFSIFNKINSLLKMLYYLGLMIVTYFVILILTIYSSYVASIVGILTAGTGSLITFYLADKFITKLSFNKRNVFIVGGLSFLVTDILLISWNSVYNKPPIEYIFKLPYSSDPIYGEVIFFWQLFVGIKLVLTLQRTK